MDWKYRLHGEAGKGEFGCTIYVRLAPLFPQQTAVSCTNELLYLKIHMDLLSQRIGESHSADGGGMSIEYIIPNYSTIQGFHELPSANIS